MKEEIATTLLKKYVAQRNELNPFQKPDMSIWGKYLKMDMWQFSELLDTIPYRWDRLHGLVDETADINTFFDEKESGRDCDDFARAWMTWAHYNGFDACEMIVSTKEHIASKAHVVTVINKGGSYFLCNYRIYGPFKSADDALNRLRGFKSYEDGFIWANGIIQYRR